MEAEIYFIAAPEVGRFKIGRTGAFDVRFSALQSSSPCRLETIFVGSGPRELEKLCQQIALELGFMPAHGEWFTGTPTSETCSEILAAANLRRCEEIAVMRAALELKALERRRRDARERARRNRITETKAYFASRRAA
jgi:hypothetical protein